MSAPNPPAIMSPRSFTAFRKVLRHHQDEERGSLKLPDLKSEETNITAYHCQFVATPSPDIHPILRDDAPIEPETTVKVTETIMNDTFINKMQLVRSIHCSKDVFTGKWKEQQVAVVRMNHERISNLYVIACDDKECSDSFIKALRTFGIQISNEKQMM